MQIHGCPGQCVANYYPEISRRNRGDKVKAGKLFRRVSASRAFAEICSLARAELQDPPSWTYKIRA